MTKLDKLTTRFKKRRIIHNKQLDAWDMYILTGQPTREAVSYFLRGSKKGYRR